MAEVNSSLSVITLSVNGLNSIKRGWQTGLKKPHDPLTYFL